MNDELLHAYLDGELDSEQRARVERALNEDPAAAARLEALREVDRALEVLPGSAASPDFTQRVLARVRRRRRGRIAALVAPLAAAAAILLAFLSGPTTEVESQAVFDQQDFLDYVWEADEATFGSLSIEDLEEQILAELEVT